MATRNDRTMVAGDTLILAETILQDDNATVKDLTGATISATFKFSTEGGTDVIKTVANSGISEEDLSNGRFNVIINPSDTASLKIQVGKSVRIYYQEEVLDGDGYTSTPIDGYLKITSDIA